MAWMGFLVNMIHHDCTTWHGLFLVICKDAYMGGTNFHASQNFDDASLWKLGIQWLNFLCLMFGFETIAMHFSYIYNRNVQVPLVQTANSLLFPDFRQSHTWQSAWLALVHLVLSFRYLDFLCFCSCIHIDVLVNCACLCVCIFIHKDVFNNSLILSRML